MITLAQEQNLLWREGWRSLTAPPWPALSKHFLWLHCISDISKGTGFRM